MKQSTKLLSLVLALVMAFSCMTVIGNAALVKAEVTYDSLDDAALAPEQVADLALDLVDNDLLADMETIDLSVLGELRLNKIDYIFEDITNLRDSLVWSIGSGLLKNLGAMDFDPLLYSGSYGLFSSHTAYQRSHGDLAIIGALLEFIGNDNNSEILSRIAYGMGDGGTINSNGDLTNTAQLNLGLIASFLDLGEIGDMLNDIPKMVVTLLYDMLVYGSYNSAYENESYPSSEDVTALPTDMDSLDEMVDLAILNLLTAPQSYEWEGEGDAATKVWDKSSIILPSLKDARDAHSASLMASGSTAEQAQAACADFVTPLSQSIFGLLDFVAQYAIDDLGINALNGNLKKSLMEAVEIDLNEIPAAAVDATAKAEFDKEDYVTFIGYDSMEKGADGNWYYTTLKTVTEIDNATGEPVLDEEGNEITTKERKYYKANMASANEFASLINWDWEFVDSTTTPTGDQIQLLYSNIVKDYDGDGTKSIVEGINDLLGLIYDAALTDEVKAEFEAFAGTGYVTGANSNLMTNVNNIAKYLLVNHGDMIFGSNSPYAKLTKEDVADKDTVDLIAMIGPGFFEDVMPQLIIPKNADGTYAFNDGVQIYEFGALVIREFMTDITPNINYYDQYIFAEGTVTSANDRLFKANTVEQWFNLILNMGLDIAYTYLYNITNFGDEISLVNSDGTYTAGSASMNITKRTDEYPELTSTNVYTSDRWMGMLDEVVMWAVKYVGVAGNTSVLNGYDATTISGKGDALDKLSYILNSLLPLGFVNGYTSSTYAFDVDLFLNNGLKAFFTDFDLSRVLGLLGRNMSTSHYNLFADASIATAVLDLVNDVLNLVFRGTILQGVNATGLTPDGVTAQSLDAVIQPANLKKTVAYILRNLYKNKDALLINALPVVGKLIKGWGTEQAYQTPEISLGRSVDLTNGATSAAQTVTIRNASNGVWRHYIDKNGAEQTDNQYQIKVTAVNAYDQLGDVNSIYVTPTLGTQGMVDYGKTTSFTYTATNVPAEGALVRFEIKYMVYDESGTAMANGKEFVIKTYAWFNYNPTNESQTISNDSELLHTSIYTPHYVPLSNAIDVIPTLSTSYFGRDYKFCTSSQTGKITNNSGTVDGLTFASLSQAFANNDGGRYLNNIRNFDSYTGVYTNEDGEETSDTIAVNGKVDEAAWTAANKTSGSSTNFSITLTDKDASENYTFSLIYYDDIYYNKLNSLAANEMDAMRLAADYNLTGTVYADGILTTANTEDEDGETVFRSSNFTATAWIDADENEYAESNVADISTVTDEDGNVTAATGTVTVDGEKVAVKKVTVIDCATAINNYVAALIPGIRGGMQAFNANSVWNFKDLYEALYVTSNDVAYCKKTTEQVVAEGNGDNIDAAVTALKAQLDTTEAETTDIKNYTDYKMWRLDRLNDARDDARYFVNLQNDASNANVDEIDESFPYTWIEEDDLRALVNNKDNTPIQAIGGTDSKNLVLALLEPITDEEKEAKAEWLEAKKTEYASQQLIDVEMASNYLTLTSDRLLPKYDEVITTYLDDELTSAENMIGIDGDIYADGVAEKYTERSWAKFTAAYENAIAVYDNLTQKAVFEAKYELMTCRNELVLVEDEADYSELEKLMAQAEYALANQSLYDNTAKELGQVLAELGIEGAIVNADGDAINLFPNSAYYINSEPYDVDDQDVIDDAATALKEALARLKFKGLNITDANGAANTSTGTIVADDIDTPDVDETVTATIAKIAAEMNADAVKALFKVTATGATVGTENITVSNDLHYTVDTDLDGFAGTNSVVTFYTLQGDVKIPVATVKIVVDGDINGDGAVDVLDGAYAQLVSNEKAELEGCYLLAGDLSGDDRVVGATDYQQIVGIIVA